MKSGIFIRFALAALMGLFPACSSFDSHWKNAAKEGSQATRWDGHWTSEKHRKSDGSPEGGRLRCVLEPREGKKLEAYFHANWLIFSSNFDMMLQPVAVGPRRPNARAYEGTHLLPAMFGGTYHYQATMDDNHFTALYTSSYDHGTFALQRVDLPKNHKLSPHTQH